MKTLSSIILFFLISSSYAQSLMAKIGDDRIDEILNKPIIVVLKNDSLINGTLISANLMRGSLVNITIKLLDGSKQKIKPDQVKSLKVRIAKPIKFSIRDEAGNVVKDVTNSFIVFEHPYASQKKPKPILMQLLNPGFDSQIKIYADPNDNIDKSILIRGVQLSSGEIHSYLIAKNAEVITIRPADYERKFEAMFGDCKAFMDSVQSDQKIIENLMAHLILYERLCSH